MYSNYIPGTDILYKLHTTWVEAINAIQTRTKYRNIYPYVFSDDMVYVIVHRPSGEYFCAYKKSTGKNDNFSSFFYWKNIGNLKSHPEQYDVYVTDYWFGDRVADLTDKLMQDKANELMTALDDSRQYYSLGSDFKRFARE